MSDTSKRTGAPEITDDMILAGLIAVSKFWLREDLAEEIAELRNLVCEVYRQMYAHRPKFQRKE